MICKRTLLQAFILTGGLLAGMLPAIDSHAQFTPGNIVVLQVGDGAAALSNASSAVFLKEYTTNTAAQSTPVSVVTVPVTGAHKLVNSGSATSEGYMALSADSLRLTLAGYDTLTGVPSVNGTTSALAPRVIDTVSYLGIPGRVAATTTNYSANNFRSAVRSTGENYYGSGTGAAGLGGTYYFGNTAAAASIQTTVNNARVINASGGNLYFSTGSGTLGIYKITGFPTTAATPVSMIATGSASSPYGFSINAGETVAYVSDDRAGAANLGGIYKYTLSGGVWSAVDTLRFGNSTGTRGIAVDWSGTYPVIYATTTDNKLIRWNDSANFAHYYTVLATAPTNTAFRGVAFAPKISCATPVLTTTVTNRTCTANGAVALNVTSGTTPGTYSWTGPSGFTATTQNISNLQAGTYTVTVTTPGGCTATASAVVTNPAFSATATATGSTTVCQGDSVTLNANTGTGYTYQWNNAGGGINGATNATYKAGATGAYTVTVTSGTNCTATSAPAISVTVNAVPVLTTTVTNRTCTANGSVVLNVTGGTTPSGFSWTGPSGFTATTQNISNLQAGTYNVTATIPGGCTVTAPATVANPTFTATVTASGSTTICQGDSVTLSANTGAGYTYQWNNAGGAITGATNAAYKAGATGAYTVTVSSGTNCTATSAPAVNVTVNTPPVVTLTPGGPTTFCTGGSVQLCANVTPAAGTYAYQWTLNSNPIAGATTTCITATVSGTYCVRVTNTSGCTATACTIVTVGAPPAAPVTPAGPLTICTGGSVTLHTNNSTGLTYQWKLNGNNVTTGGGTDSTYVALFGGSYTVVVSAGAGCSSTSAPVILTLAPLPPTFVTALSQSPICGNDTIRLKTVSTAGATYSWSANGVLVPGQTDSFFRVSRVNTTSNPIAYNVRAIVTSAQGCTDSSAVQQISVYPTPVAAFQPIRDTFCQMSTVSIAAAGTGTFRWFFAGSELSQTGSQIFADGSVLGRSSNNIIDSVRLIYRNTYGCIDTSAWHRLVFVPDPVPVITYNGGVLGTTITYDWYQWYRNGVLVQPSTTTPTYTPTADGDYTVIVLTRFGCTDTSAAFTVTGLGVHPAGAVEQVKIYPNPATDMIHIDAAMAVSISLYDLTGRMVLSKTNARDINIATLADGVYMLKARNSEGVVLQTTRVMKKS